MTESQLRSGHVLSQYRILEKLGGGGMGLVYKAEDIRLYRPFALKCLPPQLAHDAISIQRFRREAESRFSNESSELHHSRHLRREWANVFIVMEFLGGMTLKHRIGAAGHGACDAEGRPLHRRDHHEAD